ncbi:MAG: carbohydrate ABC transporter permease [Thermomicrobiales bacterium]
MASTADREIASTSRPRLSMAAREAIHCYIFMLPAILGILLFWLGPMVASFGLSFTTYDMLSAPRWIGLENYRDLADDQLFRHSLRVTAVYAVVSVPLVLVTALALAVLLNQSFRGIMFFRSVYYLPAVMSGVAVATLWRWIFQPEFGMVNALLDTVGIRGPGWLIDPLWAMPALIITSLWTAGASMLIFLAGLQGIPEDLYEAAEIDGAGRWRRFLTITVPLISHVTFFNLVLGIIGALQVFTEPYVMTGGGPNNALLLLSLYLFRNAFEFLKMGYASAIAWVLFLIVMTLTLIVFRSAPFWVHYEGERDGGRA